MSYTGQLFNYQHRQRIKVSFSKIQILHPIGHIALLRDSYRDLSHAYFPVHVQAVRSLSDRIRTGQIR